jgi:protein TonB
VTFSDLGNPIGFSSCCSLRTGKAWHAASQAAEEQKVNLTPNWRHACHRRSSIVFVGLLAVFCFIPNHSSFAQTVARKVKNRVEPVYPDLARRNNISGSARVELLVTADGRVKDVKVLGGNPVLVQAVTVAVMKWKYEPAAEDSTVVIKFDFSP